MGSITPILLWSLTAFNTFVVVVMALIGFVWKDKMRQMEQKVDKAICEIKHKELDKDIKELKLTTDKIWGTVSKIQVDVAALNGKRE